MIRLIRDVGGALEVDFVYYPGSPATWNDPHDAAEWEILGVMLDGENLPETRCPGIWAVVQERLERLEVEGRLYEEGDSYDLYGRLE